MPIADILVDLNGFTMKTNYKTTNPGKLCGFRPENVNVSVNQGCGAGTKILGSGSSSRHLKFLAPIPKRFGPLETKNHCIICTIGLFHKLCLLNGNSNFRLRLHHSKFFGSHSGSTAHGFNRSIGNLTKQTEIHSNVTFI